MKKKAYIGITGFKTQEEIKAVSEALRENNIPTESYTAMFGFLCSSKRLKDPGKPGRGSPALKSIASLAKGCPGGTIPMVHYHTNNYADIDGEVRQVFSTNNLYDCCRALQLNVDWPSEKTVERIRGEFGGMDIVLQLPFRATKDKSIDEIAGRCSIYDSLVAYVLVDPSGGRGKEFNVPEGLELMYALNESMPNTRIAIAGGFSHENVYERASAIRSQFSEPFCIDAQGRLAEDKSIVLKKAVSYIENAANALL